MPITNATTDTSQKVNDLENEEISELDDEEGEEIEEVANTTVVMSDQFTDLLSGLKNRLKLLKKDDPYLIDQASFSVSPNGKLHAIVNTATEGYFRVQRRTYELSFEYPTYLANIEFKLRSGDLKNTKIKFFLLNGSTLEMVLEKGISTISLNEIINKLEITFEPKKQVELRSIELTGYENTSFPAIVSFVKEYHELKPEFDKVFEKISKYHHEKLLENQSLDKSSKNLKEKLNSNSEELTNTLKMIEQRKLELSEIDTILEQSNLKNDQLKSQITDNYNESKRLSELILKERQELNDIAENKALIAQEIQEYIKQSNKDVTTYFFLSLIPMIIIGVISWSLFFGTYNLSTVFNKNPELNYAIATHVESQEKIKEVDLNGSKEKPIISNMTTLSGVNDSKSIDINAIFWTRLPFMLIVISILILCYKLAFLFANKIMELHHQRRVFTQIFVLAKEVSDKALENENYTLDDKVNFRTKLKMNMLREHLKNTINLDYNHKLESSLWVKIMEKFHSKLEELLTLEDKTEMEKASSENAKKPQRRVPQKSVPLNEEE